MNKELSPKMQEMINDFMEGYYEDMTLAHEDVREFFIKAMQSVRKEAIESEKERILESLTPYPSNNDNPEKEAGYHECIDNLLKLYA